MNKILWPTEVGYGIRLEVNFVPDAGLLADGAQFGPVRTTSENDPPDERVYHPSLPFRWSIARPLTSPILSRSRCSAHSSRIVPIKRAPWRRAEKFSITPQIPVTRQRPRLAPLNQQRERFPPYDHVRWCSFQQPTLLCSCNTPGANGVTRAAFRQETAPNPSKGKRFAVRYWMRRQRRQID